MGALAPKTHKNLVVEKQYLLHSRSVCSPTHPACKAHAQYYIVICGLSDTIFCKIIP